MEKKYAIAMISDFFYPNMGGIEMHIYQLSQWLIRKGHKVIVITHQYGKRQGIRYLSNGLKVYYLPVLPFYNGSSMPSFYALIPLIRHVLYRESIEIVHAHQEFSIIALEGLMLSYFLGIPTCFTDHSLFGFSDASAIHVNKFYKLIFPTVNRIILVSYTGRENFHLRSEISPTRISVIPNAVDTSVFVPNPTLRKNDKIYIVIVSRLVYRKGTDLLISIVPEVCKKFPQVNFIVGGDGNKRIALEEEIEKHQLHDRVELLGHVNHSDVPKVLARGHIFLNCSLTEAFCIAIIEATSCGLIVVTTKVGGIPEVLPEDLVIQSAPNPKGI